MTAKEYLRQVYDFDQEIKAKHARIAMLKDRETRATSTIMALRMSGTTVHSPLEDAVCKLVDLQDELAKDIVKSYTLQKEIAHVIAGVKNEDYRMLLECRYLGFCKWEQIAVMMNYSVRHITRMHGEALKHVLLCPT